MSNLWKTLRDVSRDVDPALGFEPASETRDEPTSAAFSLTPGRPRPPVAAPAAPEASEPSAPAQERLVALPSSLRRKALTNALQFDQPSRSRDADDAADLDSRQTGDAQPMPSRAGAPWDPEPTAPPTVSRAPSAVDHADRFRALTATPPGGTTRRLYGTEWPATTEAALSPPSHVPQAQPWVATAVSSAPNWSQGDDDVMPSDGRRGGRRPKLRDRLPW